MRLIAAAGVDRKRPSNKMRSPMRSSIACTRCRKSKIKCENVNGTSPCDSCIKTGNECIFKVPDPVAPKRVEPPVAIKPERDGGSDRKKLRKIDDASKSDNQKASGYADDVLAVPFLTEDLWEQVLDIFKLHFATELPFLHLPTMKERLARKAKTLASDSGSDSNLVLLGVLTLTARFHPDLVKYLAHMANCQPGSARTRSLQSQSDPAAASEYYADVLAMALGPVRAMMSHASVDRVAALLMLGLYEWSQTQPKAGGMTAWMYVGTAIRMAQYLGLGFEDASVTSRDSKFRCADIQLRSSGCQSQLALQRETRRRIMFSCFVLDRMLACGKHRVSVIRGEDLEIQLPCSEDKFDLAMEAQTGYLREEVAGVDDSVLSRFIRLVHLWGDISAYSFRGGRLSEIYPPWHSESTFYKLNKKLESFDSALPGTFTFSRSNYFKHENHHAASTFVLLHMLRFVCLIMLHREYVPFVPIRCREPEGPLDQPTFTREETPAGFWRSSAEQLFKAARGIVDLIEICQRKERLPQSTIVLFAIWTAAFVGLYGSHFPQMDTERHMLDSNYEDTRLDGPKDVFQHGPTAVTYQSLNKMSTWLKMASTYVAILQQMDKYFDDIKQDYYKFSDRNVRTNRSSLRVREGGIGGGLEEYQPLVRKLKDFGSLQPDEHDVVDIQDRFRTRTFGCLPQTSMEILGQSKPASPGAFTAINRGSALPTPEPARPQSRATELTISHPYLSKSFSEPWSQHNVTQQQTQTSPSHAYPTPGSVLDPANTGTQTHEPSVIQDESEGFWDNFRTEEIRRFGATGDLSLFSTGESQFTDVPFSDLTASSYQLLQQAGNNDFSV
ncbi:fungal-specific transcription factor domain-containing protein [Xylariaceae sp. FL1019]|nr:fungal-specific transcription factor domain-containing protein [Xylariaceae sp. FL1019]